MPKGVKKEKSVEEELTEADRLRQDVKDAILFTHVNMAAIHVRKANFRRALECALQARAIDQSVRACPRSCCSGRGE